ncbi:DNA polymerase III subunit chi [Solimicrobium silvestre]|uniref:DNA polymerase III chi subunit n=1 Tax=Solimicrobium silvestre TaxID=2099400 RepID=A0A2S9GWL6_9BURK|nr:DNA polymerase III subunit chi [Solimicrobium silvestre]PRC92115.1 DNA polymerase III chi subunit [Solimicrobium silvestre]
MTRIDFHSNVSNQLDYACRLVRKALAAKCHLVVRHQNKEQLAQFNQLLWEFSATDFLPHVAIHEGPHPLTQHTPVLLSLDAESDIPESTHMQILLNLSDQVPTDFARFERLIEIVPQAAQATQAGRERYRFYQQQGYQLNHIHAK